MAGDAMFGFRTVSREFAFAGQSVQNCRATNMDRYLVKSRLIEDGPVYLAVVCDGVGSLEHGDFASNAAVWKLEEWFDSLEDMKRIGLRLYRQVQDISNSIAIMAQADRKQTASTLSALMIAGGRYYFVQSGDSRIYLYRKGSFQQITQDQSYRGMLTGYVGKDNAQPPLYGEGNENADGYLLCTDGITKRLSPAFLQEQMERITVKTLERDMNGIIQCAIDQGETDNITLVILLREERGTR